ncbi:MAG TPA: class I SAM-dependent methyltransferase [Spirochaetota bacterium]|mgnify:FL=1|nr:class I SAM-dependent methyltransferase [Spirochaetota bacterium]
MFRERRKTCPLCGSGEIRKKYLIEKYDLKFNTDICAVCGFIFMNPLFDNETIRNFYSEEYYSGKADYSYIDERNTKKFSDYVWNSRIRFIHKFIESGNFLDVGCSFGGFLEAASRFYTPYGIEMSEFSSSHAGNIFGNTIHTGTLSDHPFDKKSFSVITMIELIEHLEDPAAAVRECFSLLKDGGLLLIQTANMEGKQARDLGKNYEYFMPGHLSYFSKRNLAMLLEKTGFRKIKVYQPVEFGLLPKLLKSRGGFNSISDYSAWLRIAAYHMKSKVHFGDFALTSSMVIYAFR